MPSAMFGIDFAAAEEAAAEVNATAGELEATLAQLDAWTAETAAAWEGQASEAYVAAQQEWNQSAQQLRELMSQISAALQTIADNARATEAANAARWG